MTAGRKVRSLSQDWGTPEKYVKAIRDFFGGQIELDPCSNEYSIVNAKVQYRLPQQDGLAESWRFRTVYVNPPYGVDHERSTSIRNWLHHCAAAHEQYNAEVVALVPVATNTGHWKKYVFGKAGAVCFLYDTRLKFLVNGKCGGKGAPMSCALVYWGHRFEQFFSKFCPFGAVVDLRHLRGVRIGASSVERQESLEFLSSD